VEFSNITFSSSSGQLGGLFRSAYHFTCRFVAIVELPHPSYLKVTNDNLIEIERFLTLRVRNDNLVLLLVGKGKAAMPLCPFPLHEKKPCHSERQ